MAGHSVLTVEPLLETCVVGEESQPYEPREWLKSILDDGRQKLSSPLHRRTHTKLHKVPKILREIEKNKECYDPKVVSIGPYHHGKPQLQQLEMLKTTIAFKYVEGVHSEKMKNFDEGFDEVVRKAMEWYDYDWKANFKNNEEVARMMFLDGCFVLCFFECYQYRKLDYMEMKYDQIALVERDLFLLENQLPFPVLHALISLSFSPSYMTYLIAFFLDNQFNGLFSRVMDMDESFHLLNLLWTTLSLPLLSTKENGTSPPVNANKYTFRSVNKLKAEGITCKPFHTFLLDGVRFTPSLISGSLSLPRLAIDDLTKSMLLNLVAYEACPNGPGEYPVTSYICFMDSLIESADDVKELRSNYVLRSFLRSDEQVADLFHDMAIGLKPDPSEHQHIREAIEEHCNNKMKTWIHSSFGGRWTSFIYVTTILVIGLSIIQTHFTIFYFYISSSLGLYFYLLYLISV